MVCRIRTDVISVTSKGSQGCVAKIMEHEQLTSITTHYAALSLLNYVIPNLSMYNI